MRAAEEGGFAYEGYVGLKLASARAFIAQLIMTIRGVKPGSPFARAIAEVIDAWAARTEASDRLAKSGSFRSGAAQNLLAAPRWVTLLLDFDLDYRRRRLHFMRCAPPRTGCDTFVVMSMFAWSRQHNAISMKMHSRDDFVPSCCADFRKQ